jgi:DNA repair exonuclease SbcCD ATPase subunit
MVTLETLRWDNCFSYGENNEVDLSKNILTQIVGENGSGKSSIPLILEEVLFGKNSKRIKKADIANRYIDNGYSMTLHLEKDGDRYEISRIATGKGSPKVKLVKNGDDISSHTASGTNRIIEDDILGMDFDTFQQIVHQNPNKTLEFLKATDTNRKKFLVKLLNLEKYTELFEQFKDIHRDSVNEGSATSGKLQTIIKWLENNILTDTNILPMQNLEIDTSKDENVLQDLMVEFKNISEKNKNISKNNQYKKMLNQLDIAALQSSTAKHTDFGDLISQSGACEAEIKREKAIVNKLTNLGQKCPTCNQTISNNLKQSMITEAATKAKRAEGEKNELRERIESIKAENAEYKRVQNSVKNWEDLYRSVDSTLQSHLVDKGQLEDRISDLRRDIQSRKAEVSRIAKENERRTKHNTRIEIIQEQTDEFQKEKKALEKVVQKQENLQKNLDILKKAFSTNGLIAYIIENKTKELEQVVNEYLGDLAAGRFSIEFIVSNDKLNVELIDNGHSVDILALSSGEMARVNTGTLIAIRKILNSISEAKINVLFLDEVISVLDEDGKERLVEVLKEEENLNTFMVSHGWRSDATVKIVQVVKDEKTHVSNIKW